MRTRIGILGIALLAACGSVTKDADDDGAADVDSGPGDGGDDDGDGPDPGYYRVYVEVTGLAGTLVLQNGGGDDLVVTEDGTSRFATDLLDGADYAVSVLSDPGLQNCHVAGGTGTVDAGDVQIAVGCYGNILMWIDDNPDGNQYNHELWMSDGTAEGTARTVNINQDETVGSGPANMTRFQGLYYFASNDGGGPALWRTDGTQANTTEVRTFANLDLGSGGLVHDGALFFGASGDAAGTELWRFDGTVLERLTNINASGDTYFGQSFTVVGNRLVFMAVDGVLGDNPWAYDLGTGVAQLLIDVQKGAFSGQVSDMVALGSRAIFRADHPTAGLELWVTDGTPRGTGLLKDIDPGEAGASINFLASDGQVAYLRANDGSSGAELWRTDGTADGTTLVRNINPGLADGNPNSMVAFAGKFWFVASDAGGEELWSTDGTPRGTQKIEVNPSTAIGSNPYNLTVVGDRLYFIANGGDGAGSELWVTDGTPEGTRRVTDVAAGAADGVGLIGPFDGRVLYFFDASYDTTALWSTDGTADGTRKVKDFCVEPACYPYAQFVRITN